MDFRGVPDSYIQDEISKLGKTPHGELVVELLNRELAKSQLAFESATEDTWFYRIQGRILEIRELIRLLTAPVKGS